MKEFVYKLAGGSQSNVEIGFHGLILNFRGIWGKPSASVVTDLIGLTERDLGFVSWLALELSSNLAVHWYKNA